MSWAARNLAAYLKSGPSTTLITPSTGTLSTTGKPASVRPIHGNAGSLALTGGAVRTIVGIKPSTGALTTTGQAAVAATKSQIISVEYVGDGASSRSFSSLGFTPLFVIVVGKDGSGNVVGALKNAFMPATESQPFQETIAAGGAARLDRIISLDANGFTVGPDLNVNGRNYAYVMFPAGRAGSITSGTYLGNTISAPGHASLVVSATEIHGNPSGSTQFVQPQYCLSTWYRPASNTPYTVGTPLVLGGRRMIRDSDGAVLAEATHFNTQSSCDGIGYILGNESNWHWEDQYIELHTLVPDLLLITCDDSPGQGVPGTITPPPTNSAIGWSLNSIGAPAFFASNTESVLHIPDTSGTSYNNDGKRYHWFALKGDAAGSGGVLMKTFQYTGTGDGPYPIDLVGCGFDPEWAYLQRAGDQFHWSKRTRNILGAHTSRRWLDGTGDHVLTNPAYTVDFISDGIEFPATNSIWNVLGTEYTVTLIGIAGSVAANIPNTGALALTGQTPGIRLSRKITPNTAELHFIGQQPRITPAPNRITPSTGSLGLTGKNPIRAQKRVITPKVGKLTTEGKAVKTKESKGHKVIVGTAEDPPSGGLQLFGTRPVLKTSIRPGTGTLSATGQRCFVRPPDFPIFTHTGALALTGQAPKQIIPIRPGTGALHATGEAALVNLSFPKRITVGSGTLGFIERQPVLKAGVIPVAGALLFETFNTEPTLEREITNTVIRPGAGSLNFLTEAASIVVPVITFITPGTGSMGGGGTCICNFPITPNTGALIVTGQPVIVEVTVVPLPQTPQPQAGGPALPTPRKLPFWPKTIISARGRIVQPPPTFHGTARVEENELEIFLE